MSVEDQLTECPICHVVYNYSEIYQDCEVRDKTDNCYKKGEDIWWYCKVCHKWFNSTWNRFKPNT